MPLSIRDPELFGVTESGATLFFRVEDAGGPVADEARVLVDGELRDISSGAAATRCVGVEGLAPGTRHSIEIQVEGASARPDEFFPGSFETLPAPRAEPVASFATLNDLHFGEPRFGGRMTEDHEYGEEEPGFPLVREGDTDVPYWRFMNEDAIDEINAAGVDFAVIKGDIADRGLRAQFEVAARTFARFDAPHHAFLGNHDYYGRLLGEQVDGYALLGQPAAPRTLDAGGWRLVLLETALPGEHHGVFDEDRLGWLAAALDEARERALPTLVLMHHQPVPPEHADSYPNTIGIRPEHSLRFYALLGEHPEVKGVLIGHTHRNRVRRHPLSGAVPFVEVNCTKDYPGGWAHYRLFADGSFRQEVRRTSSARALAHSSRCREACRGLYRNFALGSLDQRSFVAGG